MEQCGSILCTVPLCRNSGCDPQPFNVVSEHGIHPSLPEALGIYDVVHGKAGKWHALFAQLTDDSTVKEVELKMQAGGQALLLKS